MDLYPYIDFFQEYLILPVSNFPPLNDLDLIIDINDESDKQIIVDKLKDYKEANLTNISNIRDEIFERTKFNLVPYMFNKVFNKLSFILAHNSGLNKKFIRGSIRKSSGEWDAFLDINPNVPSERDKSDYNQDNFFKTFYSKFSVINHDVLLSSRYDLVKRPLFTPSSEGGLGFSNKTQRDINHAGEKIKNWNDQIRILTNNIDFDLAVPNSMEQIERIYAIIISLYFFDKIGLGEQYNLRINGGFAAHLHGRSRYLNNDLDRYYTSGEPHPNLTGVTESPESEQGFDDTDAAASLAEKVAEDQFNSPQGNLEVIDEEQEVVDRSEPLEKFKTFADIIKSENALNKMTETKPSVDKSHRKPQKPQKKSQPLKQTHKKPQQSQKQSQTKKSQQSQKKSQQSQPKKSQKSQQPQKQSQPQPEQVNRSYQIVRDPTPSYTKKKITKTDTPKKITKKEISGVDEDKLLDDAIKKAKIQKAKIENATNYDFKLGKVIYDIMKTSWNIATYNKFATIVTIGLGISLAMLSQYVSEEDYIHGQVFTTTGRTKRRKIKTRKIKTRKNKTRKNKSRKNKSRKSKKR